MSRKEFSLHPLQEAAGEKGGLVGPGRMYSTVDRENMKGSLREVNENEKTPDQSKLIKRKKTTCKVGSKDKSSSATVTAEDLTSETVSEGYWEKLAEQRRVALEATLKENMELHQKVEELNTRIELLEQENHVYKEMLKESETLVDVLKEMVGGAGDETADENSIIDNSYEV